MTPSCGRRSRISVACSSIRPTPFRCKRWCSRRPSPRRTCCSSAAMSAGSSKTKSKRVRARARGPIRARAATTATAQFAVLALYDAQRVGAKVSRETWELAADYWRRTQNDDGSWGYVPGDTGTGSMTCAGIGGLAICSARAGIGRRRGGRRPRDLLPAARGGSQTGHGDRLARRSGSP